jgi:E3 ubiquitin-protein ligase MARCH6
MAEPSTPAPAEVALPARAEMTALARRDTISSTTSTSNAPTCRICRSEGSPDEPLFYPCKCSGSIKFVHQECLLEWLAHSHKKHCELCKTPFRFTKLYSASMPDTLPFLTFVRRACWHVVVMLGKGIRAGLVASVWLVVLPWLIRWSWRWMFWVADAGWARNAFVQRLKRLSLGLGLGLEQQIATSMPNETVEYNVGGARVLLRGTGVNGTSQSWIDAQSWEPVWATLLKYVMGFDSDMPNTTPSNNPPLPWAQPDKSLLSGFTYISELTHSPAVNRVILDMFEGQLITCLVITGFILVFLIREWVVQQQPLVGLNEMQNMQNQLREAADRVREENERLRRQQDLLEQARRRLVELQQENANIASAIVDPVATAEQLRDLIDHATSHLSDKNDGGKERFEKCAAKVLDVIRATSRGDGKHLEWITAKLAEKLVSLEPEAKQAWEDILMVEIKKFRDRDEAQKSSGEAVEQPSNSEHVEIQRPRAASAPPLSSPDEQSEAHQDNEHDRPTRPRMPERDLFGRATHIRRLLEEDGRAAVGRAAAPERDYSGRATQIQRLLEEAEGILNAQDATAQRIAAMDPLPDSDADPSPSGPSSSDESWQHVVVESERRVERSTPEPAVMPPTPRLRPLRKDRVSKPRVESELRTLDLDDELPITNAGPDAKINIKPVGRGKGKARALLPPKPVSAAQEKSKKKREARREEEDEALKRLEEEMKVEVVQPSSSAAQNHENGDAHAENAAEQNNARLGPNNPFHPGGILPPGGEGSISSSRNAATDASIMTLRSNQRGMETSESGSLQQPGEDRLDAVQTAGEDYDSQNTAENGERQPQQPAQPPPQPAPTRFQKLADWFWGDIQVPGAAEPVPVANEERLGNDAQEAPFVPVADGQPLLLAPEPADVDNNPDNDPPADPEPIPDPEVAAQAAAAGLDAEAIDEAEDLEGLFELIGFQGPLIGLFQTSTFCTVLVTGTVFASVGLPYFWGKILLSMTSTPLLSLIKMPLAAVSFAGDLVLDTTIFLASWLVYIGTFPLDAAKQGIGAFVPMLEQLGTLRWVRGLASDVAGKAGARLMDLLMTDEPIQSELSGWNWAFLGLSTHAHQSLRAMQGEVSAVMTWVGHGITGLVDGISSGAPGFSVWNSAITAFEWPLALPFSHASSWGTYFEPMLTSLGLLKPAAITGNLTLSTPSSVPTIDPTLIYWSSTDRFLAVSFGYLSLALLAGIYVAIDQPISRSETGRAREKMVRDTLRQAGGVLKVILIISIEMLAFPLYCGLLLDLAFLPLFNGASVAGRWAFAVQRPYLFGFLHWFLGTGYMFHFALFVSMMRRVLRPGTLWFIRDPDDPTFHPVRDVLERSVMVQLRKIAFSALVYGALVILCLGGVIWSIGQIFEGIFPLVWRSAEPWLEFPMDLLLYNLITPLMIKFFKPSEAVNKMYGWFLRRCARFLRLSHFLFGERRVEEEGSVVGRSWKSFLLPWKGGKEVVTTSTEDGEDKDGRWKPSGKYVLTPCCDQYRPPKPGEAFLHYNTTDAAAAAESSEGTQARPTAISFDAPVSPVSASSSSDDEEEDVYITDASGKKNPHFAKIYVPPQFRLRITAFMVCLWMFSAATGLAATLVPLCFGRSVFTMIFRPGGSRVNDIYAYSVGAYILGAGLYVALKGRTLVEGAQGLVGKGKDVVKGLDPNAVLAPVKGFGIRALKCLYVYGFAGVVLPMVFAVCLHFYFVLPLHTWVEMTAASVLNTQAPAEAAVNSTLLTTLTANGTTAFVQSTQPSTPATLPVGSLANHTLHILQDYCLGLLYLRLAARFLLAPPTDRTTSRAAEAFRRVTAKGYTDPDVRLATRYLILPASVLSVLMLLGPVVLARTALVAVQSSALPMEGLLPGLNSAELVTLIYRFSYPATAGLVIVLLGLSTLGGMLGRWRARIKDEVYLVGERLHNFGEARPPPPPAVTLEGRY